MSFALLGGKDIAMKLKFKKTPQNQRNTYKYYDANDNLTVTIRPDKEQHVEAIHIKLLHSMDDAEVYNNIKNHASRQDSGLEVSIGWQEPSRWLLSLDRMRDEEEKDFKENRELLEEASRHEAERHRDTGRELLYEAVQELDERQQELFFHRYIEGMSETELAREDSVSVAAIHHRLKRIEKRLKNIIYKKILPEG